MTITIIAAVSRNGVIGKEGEIPWHLPEDFQHFKETTRGSNVLMGSATWDSLPKKPLPGRTNIVISREREEDEGKWYSSIKEATRDNPDDLYVIGGSMIYGSFMDTADKMVISRVHQDVEGDTFFPKIDEEKWRLDSEDERDGFTIEYWDKIS